jgi:hypothetical protein
MRARSAHTFVSESCDLMNALGDPIVREEQGWIVRTMQCRSVHTCGRTRRVLANTSSTG